MADKKPCCCEMAALRSEIDRRSRNDRRSLNDRRHLVARMSVRANVESLSSLPTATLISRLRDSQRAIYGTDDRRDLYQVAETELRKVADSVVALVAVSDLHQRRDGRYKLSTTRYRDDYELCPSEPFFDQPLGCDCTGFLVAPDIIATAGHCVRSMRRLNKIRFVFGFHMLDRERARTEFLPDDVYQGASILAREEDEDTGADWALVRLARPVRDHEPLRIRASGKIANSRSIFVVGHPNGLPTKIADGANVRDNRRRAYFVANLDT
jgi:trypsin-like peptidase